MSPSLRAPGSAYQILPQICHLGLRSPSSVCSTPELGYLSFPLFRWAFGGFINNAVPVVYTSLLGNLLVHWLVWMPWHQPKLLSLSLYSILTACPWWIPTAWPLSHLYGTASVSCLDYCSGLLPLSSWFCLSPQYHTKGSSCPSVSLPDTHISSSSSTHAQRCLDTCSKSPGFLVQAYSGSSHPKWSGHEHPS